MAKLSWEYDDNNQDIIVRKTKGRITIEELFEFLHKPEQTNFFDGSLAVIMFRVNSDRDVPYNYEEPEGDAQQVFIIGDSMDCPICGTRELAIQYCPDCGRKLF